MRDTGFAVRLHTAMKPQILHVVKSLVESQPLPLARADMRVRVSGPQRIGEVLHSMEFLRVESSTVSSSDATDSIPGSVWTMTLPPSRYRELQSKVQSCNNASLCVLATAVYEEGEGGVEEFVEMSHQREETAQSLECEKEPTCLESGAPQVGFFGCARRMTSSEKSESHERKAHKNIRPSTAKHKKSRNPPKNETNGFCEQRSACDNADPELTQLEDKIKSLQVLPKNGKKR